jgi:transcriptional regulator with XRE-family HTH domain
MGQPGFAITHESAFAPKGAGQQIKALREERGLRVSDVERLSQRVAESMRNPDYVIPHATLNGIENGSTPTIFKLASLATVLDVKIESLLLAYGIDVVQQDQKELGARIESPVNQLPLSGSPFAETQLLGEHSSIWRLLPPGIQQRLRDPAQYSYAIIGTKDDFLWEVLPGGSFVEIDRSQTTISRFPWNSLMQRPIYCLWHGEGHICCWCDQTGNVITTIPHPLSRQRSKQYRIPREVTLLGRVTNSCRLATVH